MLVQGPSFWLNSHPGTTVAEISFSLSVISKRAELQALDFGHYSGGQAGIEQWTVACSDKIISACCSYMLEICII